MMIPDPWGSYSLERAMRDRREKTLAIRQDIRHKQAVAKRRKAKRGGPR